MQQGRRGKRRGGADLSTMKRERKWCREDLTEKGQEGNMRGREEEKMKTHRLLKKPQRNTILKPT